MKIGYQHLSSGKIKSRIDSQWYSYVMRTLNPNDLQDVLALYDIGVEYLDNPDLLWRYPDETVGEFLSAKAVAAGVFVNERLIGFRVLYFHDDGDLENPLRSANVDLYHKITAHSALCVIHPEFRGNSLQKQLGIHLLQTAINMRVFENFCSVVSPHNFASIKDKFSLNMLIIKLVPKFSGMWRYIFYQNINDSWQINPDDTIFIPSYEYMEQIRLLEQGYYGFCLGEKHDRTGVFFGKLAIPNLEEEVVIA